MINLKGLTLVRKAKLFSNKKNYYFSDALTTEIMNKLILPILVICFLTGYQSQGQSKWIKKAKEKLEKKGDKAVDDLFGGKKKGSQSSDTGTVGANGSSGNNGASGGFAGSPGERNNTPPPVNGSIKEAKEALTSEDFSDTRYYIQQALWGIEYELGKQVLKDMPASINGVSANEENDVITSAGFGFVGLNIVRTYQDKDNYYKAQLVNGSAFSSSYNMVLSNPGMYNSSDSDFKATKVNGYKAVIEYTSKGYTIAIPFGQSSAFVLETAGLKSEDDAIAVAGKFDIGQFKKVLGEQ